MNPALLLVYFVYGLAFYALGLAVLLETGRAGSRSEARRLGCLAAFGIMHGTHEWLEAYLLQAQSVGAASPSWLIWCRVVLLVTSFGSLAAFAVLSLLEARNKFHEKSWHLMLIAAWMVILPLGALLTYRHFPVPWPNLIDAMSRYLLALPAAFLSAFALRSNARLADAGGQRAVAANLRVAALGFAVYGLTQVFVQRLQVFPASLISQDSFLSIIGLPIQVVRATMAALIAVGFLRALQDMERERRAELVAAHQARITALEQRDGLRRDLLRHVVTAQEDERARIARELHDETAQLLSAFSLDLGALRTKLKRADTTELVSRLQDLSQQMSQGLFHLMRDLRPSHLDDLGLVPALNFILNQDCQSKGLEVAFDVSGAPRRLNGLVETVLFRVAQEALANVARHAQVNKAVVQLHYDPDRVSLRVCDRGLGFDPVQRFHPPRGWGLAGMRERVESLSGQLTLQSAPGQGTVVTVEIPLDDERGKDLIDGSDHALARG